MPISALAAAIVTGARDAVGCARPVAVAVRGLVDPASAPLRRSDHDEGAGVMPMTVFLTDGDQRPALAIVRTLGRRGLR